MTEFIIGILLYIFTGFLYSIHKAAKIVKEFPGTKSFFKEEEKKAIALSILLWPAFFAVEDLLNKYFNILEKYFFEG